MWTQIVGKVRLTQTPWVNHSWHVTLYVTPAGSRRRRSRMAAGRSRSTSTSSPIASSCRRATAARRAAARAAVGGDVLRAAHGRAGQARRSGATSTGSRTRSPTPFRSTRTRPIARTIREYANRFWRVLVQADRVFKEFRARFIGKCSPVHFFWGAPDLAVTRFSGRRAPEHPGGVPNLPDWVTREAYSHEVSSCGFWPGGGADSVSGVLLLCLSRAAGFSRSAGQAGAAFYSTDLRRVHPAVRRGPQVGLSGRDAARVPADDLRSRRRTGALGSARAGATGGFRAAGQPRRLATGVAATYAASMRSMPCSSVVEGT